MNKLQAMTSFVQVVQQGSFSKAAEKLGISASAVTKGIAYLEEELGTQLLNRTTRKFVLTKYGSDYYERCVRILEDMRDAESMVRNASAAPQGRVRMVVPNSFGRVTLIPALPQFFERYPEVELDIEFSDKPVDLIKTGADLEVRTGELADSGLMRRVLMRGPITVAASPQYVARYGRPKTPEDLIHHECIIGWRGTTWPFERDGEPFPVQVSGRLRTLSGDSYREAAVCGLGIAYSTWWLFRKDIMGGNLVPLLEEFSPDGVPISVLYPARRHMPQNVVTVINFLVEIMKEDRYHFRPMDQDLEANLSNA